LKQLENLFSFPNIFTLSLANNRLSNASEIKKQMKLCPHLKKIVLDGNPCFTEFSEIPLEISRISDEKSIASIPPISKRSTERNSPEEYSFTRQHRYKETELKSNNMQINIEELKIDLNNTNKNLTKTDIISPNKTNELISLKALSPRIIEPIKETKNEIEFRELLHSVKNIYKVKEFNKDRSHNYSVHNAATQVQSPVVTFLFLLLKIEIRRKT